MKNGGPAFPYSALTPEGPQVYGDSMGMSLRDYFAAKAMQTLVASSDSPAWIAARAFRLADEMLAERDK